MWIVGAEGARLIGPLHPFHRQALAFEEVLRLVEILFRIDLEAEVAGFGLLAFPEHDAVMAAFFQRAQVDRVLRLVRHLQAEHVDVEGAALRQVGDDEFDMGEPHDVERRVKVGFGQRHG